MYLNNLVKQCAWRTSLPLPSERTALCCSVYIVEQKSSLSLAVISRASCQACFYLKGHLKAGLECDSCSLRVEIKFLVSVFLSHKSTGCLQDVPYWHEFDAGGQETSDVITATGVLQKVFLEGGFVPGRPFELLGMVRRVRCYQLTAWNIAYSETCNYDSLSQSMTAHCKSFYYWSACFNKVFSSNWPVILCSQFRSNNAAFRVSQMRDCKGAQKIVFGEKRTGWLGSFLFEVKMQTRNR